MRCICGKYYALTTYTHTPASGGCFFYAGGGRVVYSPMRWPTGVEKTFPKAPTLKNEAIVEKFLINARRWVAVRLKLFFIYFLFTWMKCLCTCLHQCDHGWPQRKIPTKKCITISG